MGLGLENAQKTITSLIPAGRPSEVGLMGVGQVEVVLWVLAWGNVVGLIVVCARVIHPNRISPIIFGRPNGVGLIVGT